MVVLIPEACKACPDDLVWETQEFPEELQGVWRRDTELLGREEVTVTGNTMVIPSLGTFQYMGTTDCRSGYKVRNSASSSVQKHAQSGHLSVHGYDRL